MVVYLGLGSNLGDRRPRLPRPSTPLPSWVAWQPAALSMKPNPRVGRTSRVPERGGAARNRARPRAHSCKRAWTSSAGRDGCVRTGAAKAPRTIDIDLLLYGTAVIEASRTQRSPSRRCWRAPSCAFRSPRWPFQACAIPSAASRSPRARPTHRPAMVTGLDQLASSPAGGSS